VSRITQDDVASPSWKYQNAQTGQFDQHFHDDQVNSSQLCGARSIYKSNRNSIATSAADHEYKGSYEPLTAQTLDEHDSLQVTFSQLYNFYHCAQQRHATGVEVAATAPLDDPTHNLQSDGTRVFNNMLLLKRPISRTSMFRNQAQNRQHSIASTYTEASLDTPNHQATDGWSGSSHGEHIMGATGYDDNSNELQYCDMYPVRELTTWGNDLAGVGEHLADYRYEEYMNSDELTID
jgi:hypothetical protein